MTPNLSLPNEVVTLSPPEIKPDNIVEFTPSDTPPPTDEAIVPSLAASKPGNLIEFSSSDTLLPSDDTETPGNFGTDTSLLSMDLLFLEENENPHASPEAPDRR